MKISPELKETGEATRALLAPVFASLERVPKLFELGEWDASYKQRERPVPWSCTLEEGLIMQRVLEVIEAKQAFEIATAFGFSGLFLARALEANCGRLLTVDCYIEETKASCVYSPEEIAHHVQQLRSELAQGRSPDGLRRAREVAQVAGLEGTIDFAVGMSPNDVAGLVGDQRLDAALIDGGHFGDQPTQDFEAILPFLQPCCAVFFHDDNNEWVRRAVQRAEAALGSPARHFDTYYSLTMVSRGLSERAESVIKNLGLIRRPWWWHLLNGAKRNAGWLKPYVPIDLIRRVCVRTSTR